MLDFRAMAAAETVDFRAGDTAVKNQWRDSSGRLSRVRWTCSESMARWPSGARAVCATAARLPIRRWAALALVLATRHAQAGPQVYATACSPPSLSPPQPTPFFVAAKLAHTLTSTTPASDTQHRVADSVARHLLKLRPADCRHSTTLAQSANLCPRLSRSRASPLLSPTSTRTINSALNIYTFPPHFGLQPFRTPL
ncbi:hypothetical protein M011DRAFT_237732 [Sporormia fimetaria CBS 119925]|uniref:Uncharacterized protein n=1 Tax=Sporormia fimetaria CBS 119925 TaxID=1340428 RepID=A0A6A6VKI0_9PLEO|nr:hypothetical protein M011DRAFT_237732 [Sporormia fimetaria CBS 119925]